MLTRHLMTTAAVTAGILLGGAGSASATIVPGEGMAGAKLGMSKAEVRSLLGKPTESRTRSDDFGRITRWYFKTPKVHVLFRRGAEGMEVTAFLTRRGTTRLEDGTGVGTSEAALRRRHPDVHCETHPGIDERSCHLGEFLPGSIVTDFRMDRRDRVGSIVVGRVID